MHRRTLLAAAGTVLVSSYVANTTPSAGSEQADRGASAIEARSKSLAGRVSSGPVRSKGESTTVTETMSNGDQREHRIRVGQRDVSGRSGGDCGRNPVRDRPVRRMDGDRMRRSGSQAGPGDDCRSTRYRRVPRQFGEPPEEIGITGRTSHGRRRWWVNGTADPEPVALWRLVRVAPRSVEATISINGDSYTRTVAVFAEPAIDAVAA